MAGIPVALQDIADGLRKFRTRKLPRHERRLAQLANHGVDGNIVGWIECIEPRLNTPWWTSKHTGEYSFHHALGGLVPPCGKDSLPLASWLDYFLWKFHHEHQYPQVLMVTGHTDCGFVRLLAQLLLQPEAVNLGSHPDISAWAKLAQDTSLAIQDLAQHLSGTELLRAAEEKHVLLQVDRLLRDYNLVRNAVNSGQLQVVPAIWGIEEVALRIHDGEQFVPLLELCPADPGSDSGDHFAP